MLRRQFVSAASLAAASALLAACTSTYGFGSDPNATRGSGKVIQESRQIQNVRAIEVGGISRLEVVLDSPESLTIEAEDNIMPLVRAEQKGDTLTLGLEPNASVNTSKGISFKVTIPRGLESLKMTDSASARVAEIKGPTKATFTLEDSSKATVASLNVDSIEADLHDSSELTLLSGQANDQQVKVFDSASYVADKLQTATGTVSASSSGKAVVNVTQKLSATAKDSGSVRYLGTPALSKQVSDSGRVEPR